MCAKGLFYDLEGLGEERVFLLLAEGHWKKKERRLVKEWLRVQGMKKATRARRWRNFRRVLGLLVAAATAWFGYQQAHQPETAIVQTNGSNEAPSK